MDPRVRLALAAGLSRGPKPLWLRDAAGLPRPRRARRRTGRGGPWTRRCGGRALVATGLMALGLLGRLRRLRSHRRAARARRCSATCPTVTVVIGVVMVLLGVWLLTGREFAALLPRPRGRADRAAGLDVRLWRGVRDGVAVVHHRAVPRGDHVLVRCTARSSVAWPATSRTAWAWRWSSGCSAVTVALAGAGAAAGSAGCCPT